MANETNLLSTPEGYATPSQLQSTREYAKALLQGNLQQPVHHWTQGVSNMVSALVGGNMDFNANKKQNESDAVRAGRMLPSMPGSPSTQPPGGIAPTSFSDDPSSAGVNNTGGDASKAIAGIESGGNYSEVGPATKTGDKAYGKYQVMGANIPEWSQAALGKPMSPEEFLANPQAQEAVFKHKFGEYTQKYGPEGAAKAWFAGEHGMNNPNAKDQLGTTVASYAQKFDKAYGAGAGAPPAPSADGAPPAAQLAASALRGRSAQPQGGASVYPQAQGAPLINPALVQRRPQYNEGQMRGMLSDPTISEQAKLGLLQQYQQQDQPITMPYPGGNVIIDPRDPRRQQFIPDLQKGTKKIGDMETPSYGTVGPGGAGGGGMQYSPAQQAPAAVGPRSEGAPPAAPTGGSQGAPAIVPVTAQNAPAAPTPAPEAVPNTGGVQVASNDPTSGVVAAKTGGDQLPGGAPPHPLAQLAQATPPGATEEQLKLNNFAPQDVQDYTAKKNYDQEKALEQKQGESKIAVEQGAQTKAADFAAKKYDTLSTQAQAARTQAPNLDLALAMLNDPNIHQGLLHGAQDVWARFKAAALGDKYANAPNETFDKLMSGAILGNMKTALGGLGQVRLAEINLLTKANANRNNTDASNRAVLEVSRRSIQTLDHLDQMGQQYAAGGEVEDPITGKVLLKENIGPDGEVTPRHGLDVGYDKLARKYVQDHPAFNADEIKHYQTIFDTGRDPNQKEATGQTGQAPPKEAINELKANPGAAAHFDAIFGSGAAAKILGTK